MQIRLMVYGPLMAQVPFLCLDVERLLDSMPLLEYYKQSDIEPIQIDFKEDRSCWIQSYDRKWDYTYAIERNDDQHQIIIERNPLAVDEIIVTMDRKNDNEMSVNIDFRGENTLLRTTFYRNVE